MTKNKIYYFIDLGVPARCARRRAFRCNSAGVGRGAHGRRSSFLRSLCRSLCPNSPRLCGVSATIPNAKLPLFLYLPAIGTY